MEEFKNWGLLLLFISAGSLIYCFLLPNGSVSKTAKSVISAAVLISLSVPVFNIFGNFSFQSFSLEDPPEVQSFNEYLEDEARRSVEKIIRETVRKYTAVPFETEIFIDINENSDINIEYVKIIFSAAPQREEELREELLEKLGIVADIRVEYVSE